MKIEKGKPLELPNGDIVLASKPVGENVLTKEEAEYTKLEVGAERDLTSALEDLTSNPYVELYKRTLADVPTEPKKMNVTMLVVAYSIWGLDEYAIARLLNTTAENIVSLKSTDLFEETQKQLIEAMRYAEAATVHGYIASKAQVAAQTVVAALGVKKAEVRVAAAKDILDRAGFRPADRTEHVHRFEDELRIKYITESDVPTVDIEAEEV